MLEIKQYDDWLANQTEAAEPITNLKNYTDYVRSSYFSAGQLNRETEQEIADGVADRLKSDGLFTDDMSDDDKNNLYSNVIGATRNADTDARFVLDYLRTNSEGPANVVANEAKASNLANYLTLREKAPSEAEGFKPYVDEILADKSLVKRARMSAVDRGEYSITALDEEDGTRTLYAGSNARPESIAGEVKSLLATGALSSSDLYKVNDFVKPLNGGLTNGAEDSRFEMFARTVSDLAKKDKDLNQLIERDASTKIEQKKAELRTTGETVLEGAKTIISYPFIKGAELLVDLFDGEQKQPKYAPDTTLSDALAGNNAFNQRFSAAEIEKFSDALTDKVAGAPYRADRPETGITTDSMGNVILAPELLANVESFNQAVSRSSLNKDQQKQASVQRKALLESAAPDLVQMILEEEPDAASSYAKARADGLSPSEFVEQSVGNSKNYDALSIRLEQFGKSAWKTLAEIPLGIAALAGNEWAAKTMGDMMKDQTRRQEFSRLYGDEYGFGFQLLNTLPQVATDIGLTIGTGGAFAGAKALAKTGAVSARAMIRNGAKMALSEIDDVAAASFRKAASAEGSQFLGKAIKDVGESFGKKFGELAPLAAVTFTRSAGSAFGSLYNQLPDDMSHEEKYKNALPAALAMGVSTSVITVGLSGLGLGAVEDIGTNVVRKIRGGDTLTARSVQEAAERAVPVSKMNYRQAKQAYQNAANEGRILSDKAFNVAAREAITSTYKNWLKTTLKGGLSEAFEESLDQAVGMAIENASLDRDISLAKKVAQVFDAGLLGGALGAGIAGSTQFGKVRKSEQSLVFEGRVSAFEDIAKRLRSNNSDATADVLQRRIDEAREQARLSVEQDIIAQKAQEEVKERTIVADPNERPLKGRPVFNEETGQWTPEKEPFDPLLDDILGEQIEYSGFEGVLELAADGNSINLRLNKPYTTEGGGSVEFINLGPRFQKASKFTAPLRTIGQETFGVPAGTPYVSMGGKKKTKFVFPAKEKVTPDSFEIFEDDEGNVRSIIVKGGLSLRDGSTTMNIPLTSSLQIKAIAEWYGIDLTPKQPVSETAEGQLEFGFANRKDLVKSKEEFGFEAPTEPELTDEELKAETEDILGRSFAPAMEGELELVTDKQNRTRRILEGFDAQISNKQKNLKKVTDTLAPLKDLSDKQLTGDQKITKQQSIDLEKKIKKEIAALRKNKREFSEDAIELASPTTQEPLTPVSQGPRVYRSWDESQKQLDRDFAESINGIRQGYMDADVPVDVDRIENIVRIVPLRNKLGTSIALSDVSIEELDAVESMAEDIISFAEDTNNKATPKQRERIIDDYRALVARVNIIQQYVVEREYEEIFGIAVSELKALQTEPEPEEEVETKASDKDTLHYLLSNTPEAFTTIDVKPFADKKVLGTLEKMGVKIDEKRRDAVETVTVTGYDQETKEILYGKLGVTVRAPLSSVNFESPALRTAIDAASTEVFTITQQAKKEAAAIKRRTARPLQDRARDFLVKVNNYVVKSKELKDRLEETKKLPAAKRSVVVPRIERQMAELRKSAIKYVNSVGSVLQSDFDFYKDLEEEQKQEILTQLRRSLYGIGGFKQEVAFRARVKAFNPTPDVKVTKVVYAKEQFRNGTQEEEMLNDLAEGGYIVNLPETGRTLAQAGLYITESGVNKFPAFSQSQVEVVEKEGQEVADTNAYVKSKHELLSEKVLAKYPQLGELVTITGRSRTMGNIGEYPATLDSIERKISEMNSAIEKDALLGRKVPSGFIIIRDGLVQQLKEAKVKLKDERYYEIDGEKYEVRNSKTDKSIYFPVEERIIGGEQVTFGVFTNNPKITKEQIAAGYRVLIPDTFDRDLFNPSQYTRDGRIIEGYYMPYNPEPFTIGSFGRVPTPKITESGEQILDDRSNFESARVGLFVNKMVDVSEIKGRVGAYFADSMFSLNNIVRNKLASKRNKDRRFPWSEMYIDNTVSDLTRGFAAELNEYRLAQNVVRKAMNSLNFQYASESGREITTKFVDDQGSQINFSDLPKEVRDEVIFDKLNRTNLVKFVTELVDGDKDSIAADIKSIYKQIKGGDSDSVIVEYAKFLFNNATKLGGRFYALPDPNTYLNRPANFKIIGTSTFNVVANRNAKAERSDPNSGQLPLDYVKQEGEGLLTEEIIGAEGADIVQALQDEMDRQREGLGARPLDTLLTGDSYASALESSDLVFMNRPALLASELYRTIAEDKTGKLAQVFRDLAIQIGLPQYQVDNLSDAVLVQSVSSILNTDYILHTNKGYARTVLSTLSGTDLGKRAAGLLIALRWLPPTMSLPLRAPAERRPSAKPAASATASPEKAIAAGKALRQVEATDSDTIDYARNYLEASQAALPYLLKLSSEKRIALNTIEEARADIYDSFRLLRTLIGQTDPEDMGPVQTKTKRQIAEGIEIGRVGVTTESVAAFQDKNVSDIEAEIKKLQDTRSQTEDLINGIDVVQARINEITGTVVRDESGKAIEMTEPALKRAKTKNEKTALKAELAELQKTYEDVFYRGDETLADLDASIATKQKQLEKAKAVRELSGPVLINNLIENIEAAYAQIKDNREFLAELSESARARIQSESQRVERLRKLPEWKQYVEIITRAPDVLRNSGSPTDATNLVIATVEASAKSRKTFDDAVKARAKALDQKLIKEGINLPKSSPLISYEYIDPSYFAVRNPRIEYAEGQVKDPLLAQIERPSSKAVATFSKENLSAAERQQSTAKSFSEAAAQIAGTAEPDSANLPTKKVGGRIKVLGKPRSYDPNEKFFSLSQIDPSLRDEARAENLRVAGQLGLVSGDPNSVLGALRRITQTGTPRQQLIAELLLTAPDFIRDINFVMVEVDLGFAGLYDKTSNSVLVNLNEHNGRGLVDVLLHEYLHAPTAKVLLNPRTESQRKAVVRIEAIRNFAIANAVKLGMDTDPVVRLGLSSNAEFLTYALTAPEFQNILAGLAPLDQRSILRRLVDAILNVFGLDPKKHEVAADAIQELLDFTKMSLSHSGTFSVDNRLRALIGTARSRNERAQAYSNLTAANLINDVISRVNEDGMLTDVGGDSIFFSISDVQKLNTPSGISLQSFASAFASRIKPETKTYQQALEIATDIIQDHMIDPEKYIVKATEEGISGMYRRFLIMPDGKEYDPNNIEHAGASAQTISIHRMIENGSFDDKVRDTVDTINDQRADDIAALADYLYENLAERNLDGGALYDSAEAAILLIAASKYAVRSEPDAAAKNGLRYRAIEMTSGDENRPFIADGKTASDVMGYLRAGRGIKDAVTLAYTKQQTQAAEASNKFGTGWYVFKKSSKHEDAVELNAAVAGTSWCTGGSVTTARTHLTGGDFHVYFENGKPEVAIRTINGRLEQPPRGNTPKQMRTQKHDDILEDYFSRSDTGLIGVEDFNADRKFLDRVTKEKGFSQFTDLELITVPRYRRSPNGHGRYSSNWPESIYANLEQEIRKRKDSIYYVEADSIDESDIDDFERLLEQVPSTAEYIFGKTDAYVSVDIKKFPKLIATNLKVNVRLSDGDVASNLLHADGVIFYSLLSRSGRAEKIKVNLPNLESTDRVFLSVEENEVDAVVTFPKLKTAETISVGNAKAEFPVLTELTNVYVEDAGSVYAPILELVTDLDVKGSVSMPSLKHINSAIKLEEDSVYDLPNATSVLAIFGVEGSHELPALTTIDRYLANIEGALSLPRLTTIGEDITKVSVDLVLPELTTVGGAIEDIKDGVTLELPKVTTVGGSIYIDEPYAVLVAPELVTVAGEVEEGAGQVIAPKLSKSSGRVKAGVKVRARPARRPAVEGNVNYIRVPEREGDTAIDVLGEIRRITPEGINIEIDNTMVGAMGAKPTKPNTILVNENLVSTMAAGLSAANARAVVRTAVDEELAHLASFAVFKTEDFAAIAAEIGPDRVNEILDMIYSSVVPDATERAARIAADREAGVTGDVDAAAEWVRMEITRMATGRTREADIAFFYTNPSLLERFLEGLRAFINKLKQQFKSEPTAGTAARISQASRSFRKLRNGGALPTPEPSAANEYGDSTAFINAINGDIAEGQEDRTYFMLPVSGTGNSKAAVSGFWKTVQDKMYNLPMELRKYLSLRDGTISQIEYTIQDFDRRFPKMRDAALAKGASIEDIGMILGTTAPVVQGEARKEIQRKVREFKTNNATDPDLERKADDYEAKLTQPEADKFFAAFRKQQKAMEDKLRSAGFGELVDYLVEFRGEINKYKTVINFDESNDVYLTRTFRFFSSEGWANLAKTGGVVMLDGKEVDFNKLRAAAAKHFEWEVNNEAKQTGQTFTAEQHDKKLVEYLDKYLENLELEAADAKKLGAMNSVRKDVNRLLRKKDFDAPLRTLLGEVTDPFENAVRTVYNVGRFAANEKFLRNFASKAIEIGVASRTRKPDMDLLFPPTQSAQLGDLAGLYVRNDIAATIREELGMNGVKQQSKAMEQINTIGRFLAKFSGLSITAKTLGSVGFYPRNVLGAVALTTSQGIVNPVYLKEAFRLSVIANMSLNGRVKAESEESRNLIRRLVELQVLKDDTQGRIAMDMLNGFVNSTDQQLEELLNDIVEAQGSGNIEKIIKKFKLKGSWEATKQAGGSTVEFLASLNNVIDSAFKLNAYFYELSELKKAYGDTETESKLEVEAARKVKLTFPTHSEQLSLAKAFNKSPFSMVALPFVRWKTEVLRTMFNTVPLAVEEIKSGNPVMRSRGVKRLIGFVTTMIGGSAAYGAVFATLFSLLTDDEEDERDGVRKLSDEELDALRQGLPVWQRNHGIFAQLLQDGSVQVIDMSNILPHSQITDIAGLASRGNIKGIADYITSEMIGTQIAASAVLEVAQNRDDFGQPIYLDTDGALGASFKMLSHLASGTIKPSVVDKAMKIGRYGEQNAKEMIVGELTGVRPIIHKVTDIEYRGMRNLKESADAVVSLLYPLSSGKALDPSKIEGIMDDHQAASNKNQQKMHDFLMGMKSLGSTEASLAATAQQMKFSKQRFGAALAGENIPWGANEQWFRKMYDNVIRVGEQNPDERASEINRVRAAKADGYNVNFLE